MNRMNLTREDLTFLHDLCDEVSACEAGTPEENTHALKLKELITAHLNYHPTPDYTRFDTLVQVARDAGHRDPEAGVLWYKAVSDAEYLADLNDRERAETCLYGLEETTKDSVSIDLNELNDEEWVEELADVTEWFDSINDDNR